MKAVPVDYLSNMEDHVATVAMDVDDVDALDLFGGEGGPLSYDIHRLADADFFNSFEDDFDDSDIN